MVTGGGSGLGRELCLQIAKLGKHISVTDINAEGATQKVSNITENRGIGHVPVFDVSNPTV